MNIKSLSVNFIFSFALLCISFYTAWQLSAVSNFFYSTWYEVIDIDETIEIYAPKNKNRKGFEQTNKSERVKLFKGIVTSIQKKGEGLSKLQYEDSKEKTINTLLTQAEVVHLQDVANLVDKFKYLLYLGLFFSIFAFILMYVFKIELSSIKNHIFVGLGLVLIGVISILVVGAKSVFYAAHELIFPDNHQWFFYYEDSLMSTMMKAPVLFAPIAIQLLFLTLLLWMILLFLTKKLIIK